MGLGRVHAFDWLRGVAVVVMVQTHSLVLLRPELHSQPLFTRLVRLDGLVAPSFIFSAGFALALVQCRAAADREQRAAQARKSLRRIGEVLAVASLVNFIWFPLWKEPKWLFRIDILQCIGLSLLLALPLLVGLATRPKALRWVMLALAAVPFGLGPLCENLTGVASIFLNTQVGFLDATTGTTFPLLPWAGYVFLGASFGATVATMKHERELWAWLGLLWGLGAVLWAFEDVLKAAYPPHHFWVTNPANAAQRWVLVLSLVAVFRFIETRVPASVTSRPVKVLGTFGASSLSAYFFHEMLLYQRHVGLFTRFWRERCDFVTYWPVLAALIAATWACVVAFDWARARLQAARATPQKTS